MASTESVIRNIVRQAGPVKRLPAPSLRALTWLLISLPFVGLVAVNMELRTDLPQKLSDTHYVVEQTAVLLTAVFAAFAAFWATVPSTSRLMIAAPLAPLSVWLGSLTYRAVQDFGAGGSSALSLTPDWACFPGTALVGSVPAIAMAMMLRRGVPMYPHLGVALGGLAAAATGNFGLRLFHPEDASIMVLTWQVGTVALLTFLAGCVGPRVHCWEKHRAEEDSVR